MTRVLITGASRGIGESLAKLLSNTGDYFVYGTSTSVKSTFIHKNFKMRQLNLEDSQSIASLIKDIEPIDILINNAAVLLEDWSDESIDISLLKRTFNINLFGTVELTEELLKHFNIKEIVNVSSSWGSFSEDNFDHLEPLYKMSKASLNMYTKLLSSRLKNRTIVSSIDPGWTKTDMGGTNAPTTPDTRAKEIYNFLLMNKESGYFWHNSKVIDW